MGCILLVDDHHQAERGAVDRGREAGVCRGGAGQQLELGAVKLVSRQGYRPSAHSVLDLVEAGGVEPPSEKVPD